MNRKLTALVVAAGCVIGFGPSAQANPGSAPILKLSNYYPCASFDLYVGNAIPGHRFAVYIDNVKNYVGYTSVVSATGRAKSHIIFKAYPQVNSRHSVIIRDKQVDQATSVTINTCSDVITNPAG